MRPVSHPFDAIARLLAVVLAVAAIPGSAIAAPPGVTDTTIKIGLFGPLSGPNLAYGQDILNASRMWYNKVNAEGGINGRKIELVIEDDRCDPSGVLAAVKKLVEQDQVFMLDGGSCSAAVVAARDYVDRAKVPWIIAASADGAIYPPSPYIYGGFGLSQHSGAGSVVEFAAKALHAKSIGYINHNDAYGTWGIESAQFAAKQEGVKLFVESVDPGITDMTAPMLRVRANNPDVIAIMTYARPAALILRQAQQFGLNKPIVMSSNGAADLKQLVENAGGPAAFEDFYVQLALRDVIGGPSIKWVYDMYKSAYPDLAAQPDHPQVYMPYGIAPAMAVGNALKEAGHDLTRDGVVAALQHMNFDSNVMAGPITFSADNHDAMKSSIFFKFNGTTQTVMPGSYSSPWRSAQ